MTVIRKILGILKFGHKSVKDDCVYCRRCGKKLTTRESKMLGLGKQCYHKEIKTNTKPLF